jgi:hypothetical protein
LDCESFQTCRQLLERGTQAVLHHFWTGIWTGKFEFVVSNWVKTQIVPAWRWWPRCLASMPPHITVSRHCCQAPVSNCNLTISVLMSMICLSVMSFASCAPKCLIPLSSADSPFFSSFPQPCWRTLMAMFITKHLYGVLRPSVECQVTNTNYSISDSVGPACLLMRTTIHRFCSQVHFAHIS